VGRSRAWTMAASARPVAVTTSDEFQSRLERSNQALGLARGEASGADGYWVSSNRAVTVTVSLSSPASIGVGAGAPAA
jgi:hypothetical protein